MVSRFFYSVVVAASCIAATACSGGGGSVSTPGHPSAGGPLLGVSLPAPSSASNSAPIGLSDDFSGDAIGAPAAGWNVASGTWSVCSAAAVQAYCQTSAGGGETLAGGSWWTDYTLSSLVTYPSGAAGGAGIIGRAVSATQYYLFELRPKINGSTPYWYVEKDVNGTWSTLAAGPLAAPDANPNYGLRLSFSGSQITASIAFDGSTAYRNVTTVSDTSNLAGQVGLRTWSTPGAHFSTVVVSLANAALPSESAVSANTFIDSMGMNAHFESSIYYTHFSQVSSLIANLGIRHYRVSAGNILAAGGYAANLATLHNSYGTTYDVLSDLYTSPAQVLKALARLPAGSVDSVEGPNETDNPGQGMYYDPHFATDIAPYVQALHATLKSTPATAQVTLIGPAFINSSSYAAIGNISGYIDAGNMHNYFAGFNPGTLGWGGGGFGFAPQLNYGSIAWNMAASAQASGTKPVFTTETGYSTAPIHGAIPLDVQAKYVPRLFLEQYRNHVPRTFLYQLIGYNMTTSDGTLDIVSPSLTPTPAYTALAGMIGLLNDGSAASAVGTFTWGLSGQTTNVHHVVIRKSDGTAILPLWIEALSFDPNANAGTGAKLTVPAQTVVVYLPRAVQSAVLWSENPATGQWTSKPVQTTNGSLTVVVTDSVSILGVPPS